MLLDLGDGVSFRGGRSGVGVGPWEGRKSPGNMSRSTEMGHTKITGPSVQEREPGDAGKPVAAE